MQCLKCGHKFSDQRKICMYCGAQLGDHDSSQIHYNVSEERNVVISDEQNKEVKLKDLPEHLRHKVEDALRKGDDEVIVKEERTTVQQPLASAYEERNALSYEKILTLLSKMRDSLNNGHIEYRVYERMVADFIKDYISTLADNIKLDFVVNKIKDSELSDYLNDEMLNDLRGFVLSSISDKK